MELFNKIKDGLVFLEYEYLGEAGIPGRHYFRKRMNQAFNVHVVLFGSELWSNNLLFRDYLKNNKDAAAEYRMLKMEAIEKGFNTFLLTPIIKIHL